VRRIALAAAVVCAACAGSALAGKVATVRVAAAGGTFTGLGFDTCTAPSLSALGAWLASPYRAVGIYVGGANRACGDGNLSASWVTAATAGGWSLIPLYVGLQAPCVSDKSLARIDPASAASEGTAAADDAVQRAQSFGLGAGVPLYFDMEGYSTGDQSCTQAVQQFVAAWDAEVHALGYVAGVYGSAASTIRDLIPLVASGTAPDDVDIGHWNGNQSVFGDSYVPDRYWPSHQRIHQYRGGHDETFGGVTLNVDDDSVDAAVAVAAAPPAPTGEGPAPAGSLTAPDGLAVATWPAGALPQGTTVTLAPSALATAENGFAAGSYLVQLSVSAAEGSSPPTAFAAPIQIRFVTPALTGVVPSVSPDGQTWSPLLRLPSAKLPAGATAGYTVDRTGRIVVLTTAPSWFGLLRDVGRPSRPSTPQARVAGGALHLAWAPSQDNSGTVAGYRILRGGVPVKSVPGTATSATIRASSLGARSVIRVAALDGAGNASAASGALVVLRRQRPGDAPKAIPAWAWKLLDWLRAGRTTSRPKAPHPLPHWFWHWATWQLQPYRLTRNG
jgi:hypothetical protein